MNLLQNSVRFPFILSAIIISFLFIGNVQLLAENSMTGEFLKKIDTSEKSGIDLWIINLYNDDRIMFAIIVTLLMIIVGVLLAGLTELILKCLGLKHSKLEHIEY